jgi:F-type H+-transporting ATPase subunit b
MATETETVETHGATEAAHETPFPPFNPEFFASQLLWLAICFIAFYYLMKKVALPRIGGILEVRRDRIASDLDHAQRLKEQSDDAIAAYEQALASARQKAYGIAEEARAVAAKESDVKRAASEAELNERLAAAERRIADIKTRALGEVNGIAIETAEAVVEALIGSKAPRDEIERAVARAAKE